MSTSDDQKALDCEREQVEGAEARLYFSVVDACAKGNPWEHRVVQHRDGKPPWCPHCGRTDRGERIKHVDQ